jgi:DNA-binding LytR/AlgR family response regulator
MEKISVLVVEDELIVSEEIKEVLIANGYHVIGQAAEAKKALSIIEEAVPDVVLMDINIKGSMDGIELANEILSKYQPAIIFLTAFHDNYFIERAKTVRPAAYLVKPFDEKNLIAAIEIAFGNTSLQVASLPEETTYKVNDSIFFKSQTRFTKFSVASILFVKAEGSYIDVFTESGKTTLAINLKQFEARLADPRFMRVHRSYLINLDRVDSLSGNILYIHEERIPVSLENRDDLMKRFKLI